MWPCSSMCWKRKDKGDTKASSLHFALDAICKDDVYISRLTRCVKMIAKKYFFLFGLRAWPALKIPMGYIFFCQVFACINLTEVFLGRR